MYAKLTITHILHCMRVIIPGYPSLPDMHVSLRERETSIWYRQRGKALWPERQKLEGCAQPTDTSSQERQERKFSPRRNSPLEALGRDCVLLTPCLGPRELTSDFCPLELWQNKSLLLMVICCSSHRKLALAFQCIFHWVIPLFNSRTALLFYFIISISLFVFCIWGDIATFSLFCVLFCFQCI